MQTFNVVLWLVNIKVLRVVIVHEFFGIIVIASSKFGLLLDLFIDAGICDSFMVGEWGAILPEVVVYMKYLRFK